jgi:hypothetical protein
LDPTENPAMVETFFVIAFVVVLSLLGSVAVDPD